MTLKASAMLLPLLGITWIFGYFTISEETLVFMYIFNILNCFQVSISQSESEIAIYKNVRLSLSAKGLFAFFWLEYSMFLWGWTIIFLSGGGGFPFW